MPGNRQVVLVRGSGDVGSAVAHLLLGSGYGVVIHERELPAAPRRGMAFTDAVFDGTSLLDGVRARRLDDLALLPAALALGVEVALSIAPLAEVLGAARPAVLVDARMRKRATPEPQRHLAGLTVGLGPNFVAGEATHLAIETMWGEALGAVLRTGSTRALAGEPRSFEGHARDRFVYAPTPGVMRTGAAIGQRVERGAVVATIDDHELRAPLAGILRGLSRDGVPVEAGAKVLEVDPRGDPASASGLGVRPRRIALGVLAAIATSAPLQPGAGPARVT